HGQEGRPCSLHRGLRRGGRDPRPRVRPEKGRAGRRPGVVLLPGQDRRHLRDRAREPQRADRPAQSDAMRRRIVLAAAAASAFLLTAPATALAHGIKGKTDLPIPRWLFAWGAGVGLVIASVLFGDVFSLFSPWRAAGRAVGWLSGRVSGDAAPAPLPYPHRLGRWPAALGIAGFAWLELVYSSPDQPRTLAILMLVYAGLQLVGMSFYGVGAWTERGDAFGVYYGLFARLSPWERRDGVLYLRPPLSGLPSLLIVPGTVGLLCTMIGSTTFD